MNSEIGLEGSTSALETSSSSSAAGRYEDKAPATTSAPVNRNRHPVERTVYCRKPTILARQLPDLLQLVGEAESSEGESTQRDLSRLTAVCSCQPWDVCI